MTNIVLISIQLFTNDVVAPQTINYYTNGTWTITPHGKRITEVVRLGYATGLINLSNGAPHIAEVGKFERVIGYLAPTEVPFTNWTFVPETKEPR